MTTANVQLWHSVLVLVGLVGAALARAAFALKARAGAEAAAPAAAAGAETPTRRLAA
jgi:hypothetical protein